jgi:ABC-type Na+ transport system ATPase subunit NatA
VTALLVCEAARIDVDGAVALEALSLTADGARVALIGQWQPLFALLGGAARLRSGTVTLSGADATSAVADGVVGLAPLDPPLYSETLVERWLWEGARLAGFSRREARDAGKTALSTLALPHLVSRRFGTLTQSEKRGVVLAQALLGAPPVLAVEDPCVGLDERGVAQVADIVERAAAGRSLVISTSDVPNTGPALVPKPRYLVGVTRNLERLAERLSGLGLNAKTNGAARLLVELPDDSATGKILDAAVEADSPVIELRPLAIVRPSA